MPKTLEEYGESFEADPLRFLKRLGCAVLLLLPLLGLVGVALSVFGFFTGAANNAVSVAKKEFYPDALLRKYEWFKDAAAALDQKNASIEVYRKRLGSLESAYSGQKRGAWPRDDREQYNQWLSELAGIKASYNELAAEYNSQMSKFNYRFTHVGDLPPGASKPLPREYRAYLED